jgi:hypothetical protein
VRELLANLFAGMEEVDDEGDHIKLQVGLCSPLRENVARPVKRSAARSNCILVHAIFRLSFLA